MTKNLCLNEKLSRISLYSVPDNNFCKMSKTYSFSLNDNEVIEASSNLGVTPENFGRALKVLVTQKINSQYFPKKLFAQVEAEIMEKKNETMQNRVESMDRKDLERALGISKNGNNNLRRIKATGMYYKTNVEKYLADFMMNWNGTIGVTNELIMTIQEYNKKEYMALEYAKRLVVESGGQV